ncbi:MAG: cytochrome c [Granulosicoccus sp.]
MMKFTSAAKRAGLVLAVVCLGISYTSVAADGPFDKAIKARQAMFQIYGFNIGLLGAMAKEKMPYDAAIAAEAAANLNAAANLGQSQMWPPGSDNATAGNATNRALPALWETYPAAVEKGDALKEAAAAMAAVAGDGLGALQGAMGDLGASCKGCHDDFRAEKK